MYIVEQRSFPLSCICFKFYNKRLFEFIIIIIKKLSAVQGWEKVIYTLSVQRPQLHNTNL